MDTPSKVLHVRHVAPGIEANDIRQTLSPFGQITYIVMITKNNQALVEMQNEAQASAVIQYTRSNPISIKGREVEFNFSKSQEIKRAVPGTEIPNTDSPGQVHQGEHMLLMTILNPLYPIDVDVLHSILHPYGNILRIVIFHKNGTQALIEFDNPASAANSKQMLDGKDIYDGCCTLRISFSRAEKLNVRCNNDKTRDFTNPHLPAHLPHESQFPGTVGHVVPSFPGLYQPNNFQAPMSMAPVNVGGVLMVYNLPREGLTCDRIFNLFCLYGNVSKVKLLTGKEGTAMVQMFDKMHADQALAHINKLNLGGQEVVVTYSKHPYIAEGRSGQGEDEVDHQLTKDYTNSQCNRFVKQHVMSYKHIYPPSSVLYFSNVSPTATEQSLIDHFSSLSIKPPNKVKMFPTPSTPQASPKKTGLFEFGSVEDAAMAIFASNNFRLDGHTLKLAFSNNSVE
eukprot:c261_g1_i1.p1 GENE.c261_g1_i1~~c261_g1_i1.p1  ORF type:complete len:453 (-),score=107.16 c261_g1_i1:190-1548(-)